MNQYIKGEGPYIAEQWEGRNEFVVVGPGWETVVGTYTKNESDIAARFANLAHAEGRKAAENDFEVLLEFTNCTAQMLKEIWAVYFPSHDPSFLVKFTAWKKARGIE
jgi:hypothetical protein